MVAATINVWAIGFAALFIFLFGYSKRATEIKARLCHISTINKMNLRSNLFEILSFVLDFLLSNSTHMLTSAMKVNKLQAATYSSSLILFTLFFFLWQERNTQCMPIESIDMRFVCNHIALHWFNVLSPSMNGCQMQIQCARHKQKSTYHTTQHNTTQLYWILPEIQVKTNSFDTNDKTKAKTPKWNTKYHCSSGE